jgi:hypothetical protein
MLFGLIKEAKKGNESLHQSASTTQTLRERAKEVDELFKKSIEKHEKHRSEIKSFCGKKMY